MSVNLDQHMHLLSLVYEELTSKNKAKWGKMNAQQMVEHLSLTYVGSTGKFGNDFRGDPEKAAKRKAGFFSRIRPFPKGINRPGTNGDSMPPPLRCNSMEASKAMLKKSVDTYFSHFEKNPEHKVVHPYFGYLAFEEWLQFHIKHLEHHLMQFGVIAEPEEVTV